MARFLDQATRNLFSPGHHATAYLTGMRAYAALAVVLIHTGKYFRQFGHFGHQLVDCGKYGVEAFYVLSAFTISASILHAGERFSFSQYLKRRILRIYPLYAVVLIFLAAIGYESYWGQELVAPHGIGSLFAHLSLWNIVDLRYANNAVGVEWSIPVEFTYYLLLPSMVWMSLEPRRWVLLIPFVLLITKSAHWMPNTLPENYAYLAARWHFQTYAWLYVLSVFAAVAAVKWQFKLAKYTHWTVLILLLIVMGLYIANASMPEGDFFVWLTILVILNASGRDWLTQLIFENRVVIWLGNISFSMYLLHLPLYGMLTPFMHVISNSEIVRWCFFIMVLMVISSGTYLLVERPCLDKGFKPRVL